MDGFSIGQLTSLPAVITAAIFLTWVAKRALASVPVASRIPIWVYTATIAAALTYLANQVVGSLPGQTGELIIDAVINGALASGIREWVTTAKKPLAHSSTAQEAIFDSEANRMRSLVLPFLLVASLGVSSCALSGNTGGWIGDLPNSQPTAEQAAAINKRAVQAAEIGTAVIGIADKALDAVHRVVPPSQLRLDINSGFDAFGAAMENIAVRAQDIVEDLSLQTFVQEILHGVDDLLGVLEKANHPDVSKYAAEIRDKVQLLRAMVGGVQ